MPSPFAGAEIITLLAPAVICLLAPSLSTNLPVDSMTISTPNLPHGKVAGSFSAKIGIDFPFTFNVLPTELTSALILPCAESYFNRCASVSALVKSLMPTTCTSFID
jgi:hypothetical protein